MLIQTSPTNAPLYGGGREKHDMMRVKEVWFSSSGAGAGAGRRPRRTGSAGRHGLVAAIVVEAAARLAAEPARLDIFHEKRAGAVFRIRKTVMQHLHDGEAGVEADEVGELQGAHGMVGAEAHGLVDAFDGA